ncbi:HlyD family efflux transporter periplasmic adaptor subunit [Sphingomonas oligophenolica]|uniref:HlyD family efflux transporter periplasmic adaptor subunit n=1 Tax=Sphingomonas oligophenolica TaxID=301154 RepID=A0ABU9Y8M0_9SPHN
MTKFVTGPRIIMALVAIALGVALFFAIRTPAIDVETGAVDVGPMAVTINDQGETRVRDMYTVSAPITGELLRVPLKPGAAVIAGRTVLARIRPAEPGALDARTLAQTEATIRALDAQAASAQSQVREAAAAQLLAERQLDRTRKLSARGFVTQASLDQAQAARDRARATSAAARQAAASARYNLDAARAGLIAPGSTGRSRGDVTVTGPVSGTVLTVPQESARVVVAGTPLVTIGDPANLEIVTDLLSADAVRVLPGADVAIEDWGGDRPLRGKVRLVEPYGFLKISALGVEEQRVNVVIDFADPRTAWERLGHGFRANVRITVWSSSKVRRVPISAIFRHRDLWSAFVVDKTGHARLRQVAIGKINDEVAEVRGGLAVGDRVILHPGDAVADGVKVRG